MTRPSVFLSCLVALLLGACTTDGTSSSRSAEDEVRVATVNGQDITRGELDEWIRSDLFDREVGSKSAAKAFEARRTALDRMIAERVIEAEAEKQGTTAQALIEAKVEAMGPVTDEDVRAYYDENKDRIPGDQTFEMLEPRIRQFLEQSRPEFAAQEIIEAADVEVDFSAPRAEIAAIGPSLGPDGAPVTIVEFSDFQCPYCSRAVNTLKKVHERFPEQVRIVYRHLPLGFHAQARPAAIAAVCADQQGEFWPYHDRLFEQQQALGAQTYADTAEEVGLDLQAFLACVESPEAARVVDRDQAAAAELGVTGTPAFFVNGLLLSGARPFVDFENLVTSELERLGVQVPEADES